MTRTLIGRSCGGDGGQRQRHHRRPDHAIEAGATYVFDLGYYDFGWWVKMDAAGCRIVTRFKSHTPLSVTAELDVPKDGNILSDRIGLLPQRQARSRRNPFNDPVREVRVGIEIGKVLRMAQVAQKAVQSPLAFTRLVRANLMHRRRIDRLIGREPEPRIDPNQMVLQGA